ncbi:MAG: TolC family protein [Armatimonadetes bacterium]|nr:TolC family protein [Armatimonadota bacterium]
MKPYVFVLPFLAVANCPAQEPLSVNDALRVAAQNRPIVRAARLRLDQARLAARVLGSYPPTFLGVGRSTRSEVGGSDEDLFLSQPVDLFGRSAAGRKAGFADVKRAEAEYRGVMLDLQTDVLEAYFQAVTATRLASSADELLKLAEGLKNAAQRRFDEGLIPEVQLLRADLELQKARQTASLRRAQRDSAIKRFRGTVGFGVSDLDLRASLAPLEATDVSGRADLLQLQAEALIAEAEAGISRAARMPELELQARRSPWTESQALYGARIQLTWALFDHGKSRFEVDSAKKRAEAAFEAFRDASGRAEAELAALKGEIEADRVQVENYGAILDSLRALVAKSQKGFSEGVGTLTDVLETTRTLRETEQEAVEASLRFTLAVTAQYKAAGHLSEVLK